MFNSFFPLTEWIVGSQPSWPQTWHSNKSSFFDCCEHQQVVTSWTASDRMNDQVHPASLSSGSGPTSREDHTEHNKWVKSPSCNWCTSRISAWSFPLLSVHSFLEMARSQQTFQFDRDHILDERLPRPSYTFEGRTSTDSLLELPSRSAGNLMRPDHFTLSWRIS